MLLWFTFPWEDGLAQYNPTEVHWKSISDDPPAASLSKWTSRCDFIFTVELFYNNPDNTWIKFIIYIYKKIWFYL
jgi:hypothetical protein